jgi:hypothetical protein
MRYVISTDKYIVNDKEGWTASITDGYGGALIDRDGDSESEAITIAVTELLGKLPEDFPLTLIEGTPASRGKDAWATLYDFIEGEDDFNEEELKAIDELSSLFMGN